MALVYLGLGSNIEPRRHLCAGLDALWHTFGALDISPVYESAAVGFAGPPFINLVVGLHTELSPEELARGTRAIEHAHGRRHSDPKFSSRTLDIDVLTHGDSRGCFGDLVLPRDEIDQQAYVLRPLAELAPDEVHPIRVRSYGDLWREMLAAGTGQAETLRRVEWVWRGRSY